MTTDSALLRAEAAARARSAQTRKTIRSAINYAVMIGLAFFFAFPIVIMLVSSFKPDEQIAGDMRSLYAFIPRNITTENYSCADYDLATSDCSPTPGENPGLFERLPFGRIYFNSVFVTASIVIGGLLVNSMAAFALARLNFPGKKLLLTAVIAMIIIPFEALAVPLLLQVNSFPWIDGSSTWINSYQVQIFPFMADAFSIFLFYQFFIGIPKDFDEAARVDGANIFTIYWRIIVPLSLPVFATVAILQALTHWGSFLWPLMATRGFEFQPLPVAMRVFFGQAPRQWGDIMAFASLATVPVLILFLLFQRWFVQSVASAGVKG
ncbi:MAG: carbohydrate ABC transporter permease [Anaerolineae bacterium]|nr:carbohydrate ABC transporter permease [Anaerolineae bacterium]